MRKMFSKNQIEEIVKQGMDNGTIPSGTQLYLHVFSKSDDSAQLNIIDARADDYDADELAGMYLSQIVQGTYYVNASGDEHALLTLNDGGAWYYDVNGGQFTSITINKTQFPSHTISKF